MTQQTKRRPPWPVFAGFLGYGLLICGCTLGDGEGPRYTAHVTKVSATEVCVGPNESSQVETCGSVPSGLMDLPHVGQCVSLFARFSDSGRRLTWTEASLRRKVDDSECQRAG
ncbi:hypothetical protein HC028_07210 [Planosporangium flavigriseum]|uniref:Uncharacterized protein n=1 Tax=Planosporangium flavigriseum TaxID=373681 RepID=A0A8J3LID2_9ACTN|nr:hypothetical protein [Planosporangium flavigriseum]NJC64301.1 hypothetical protein [Planosporangium flavigriseum]GIG73823.1 hypothetical protein Pfl04_22270 [Planosporangium flavigriseum]